ncbi:hypothetical protein DealDRAFT_0001, partial [Dethiobacter alkaliphilus AHT 1]
MKKTYFTIILLRIVELLRNIVIFPCSFLWIWQ